MERNWTAPFEVKAAGNSGRFTGRASVYGVRDSYGDVVMPGAFSKTLAEHGGEIVVLNQHNPADPIGKANLTDSDTALLADGQLVLALPSAHESYVRLQNGLITGISIGYEVPAGGDSYVSGVRQLNEIRLFEISLVTFPANQFARITDVKRRGAADVADVVPGLKHLADSMKAWTDEQRAKRLTDPVISELEVEFRKLNNAVKRWGADDPDVVAFAQQLRQKLEAARSKLAA